MPFARISLRKGKSPEYLRALSDSLHQALVEAFEVPEADRFQLIHQHEPEELVSLLDAEGWDAQVDGTRWFIFGSGRQQ